MILPDAHEPIEIGAAIKDYPIMSGHWDDEAKTAASVIARIGAGEIVAAGFAPSRPIQRKGERA